MVDTEGPIKVESKRGESGEDRKVHLIMHEMKRYKMKVVALQETNWFRSDVYYVAGSVVLTSGWKKPATR